MREILYYDIQGLLIVFIACGNKSLKHPGVLSLLFSLSNSDSVFNMRIFRN
jgi:hypothetical protein